MSVELSTLMVTSKLMTGFDDPPVYLKKLRQQAMIQALRTPQAIQGGCWRCEEQRGL